MMLSAIGHWLLCNTKNISFLCFKEYLANLPTPLDLQLWPFSRQLHTICLRLKKDANTSPAYLFCSGSLGNRRLEVFLLFWLFWQLWSLTNRGETSHLRIRDLFCFVFLRVSTASRQTQGSSWIRKRTMSISFQSKSAKVPAVWWQRQRRPDWGSLNRHFLGLRDKPQEEKT